MNDKKTTIQEIKAVIAKFNTDEASELMEHFLWCSDAECDLAMASTARCSGVYPLNVYK